MTDRRTAKARLRSSRRQTPISRRRIEWQVYALSTGDLPSIVPVSGRRVHVLAVGGISALGAMASADDTFSEAALREQHDIVLGLAERIDPLLPVRFGTRISHDQIEATLLRSRDVVMRALENVRGRQQMTLRLIGVPAVEPRPAPARSGADYLQQRRAASSAPRELEAVLAAVKRFVVQERMSPGRGGVRATLFHLVDRNSVASYLEAVEQAAITMPADSVSVTGPWPPFAFAPELPG